MNYLKLFFQKIKYVHLKDIPHIFLFLLALPCSLVYKRINNDLWIISENPDSARDNSYHLFKYIIKNHPEQKIVYAIKYNCPDYKKVASIGKTVPFGTFAHWIYYLAAKKIIISVAHMAPNISVAYFLEVYGILKNNRYFLQHGITINNLTNLNYKYTKFKLFVCGAKPEFEFIKEKFEYPKNIVQYLGFCRFDELHDLNINKKQILVMPTWRHWLSIKTKDSWQYDDMSSFEKSEYFIKWNELLNSCQLHDLLEENDLELVFYPHRSMNDFIHHFKQNHENIRIANWRDHDIAKLLKSSIFLITDYSSVFMDFAYMNKPLLYYQFDYDNFRKGHLSEGYFSYENNGFGPVCYDKDLLIKEFEKSIKSNFVIEEKYSRRIDGFFELHDTDNCRRNYEAIKKN